MLTVHFVTNVSSDDEYRLLRQSVFEQYSSSAVIPAESPLVPIVRVGVHSESLLRPLPTPSAINCRWHIFQGHRQRQTNDDQRLK